MGEHILKTYFSTQPTVGLSSGEAPFYGVERAAGTALGQQSLFADLCTPFEVRAFKRRCGHVRSYSKVRHEVNPADL